jgi:hypothetical protein
MLSELEHVGSEEGIVEFERVIFELEEAIVVINCLQVVDSD